MFTIIQKEESALRLFVFLKKILQSARADVYCWSSMQTGETLLGFASPVTEQYRYVGTCWAKSLTGFKLYATSANIVVVPCKRTQQVTTLFGPTMLGVVGQQCCVRLHGPSLASLFETKFITYYYYYCYYYYYYYCVIH